MQHRLAKLFVFVFVAISLWAQAPVVEANSVPVPPLVKFSGTISGASSGTAGVIFALYKDQTGGAPLWQEVQNITLDASGHYTAFLGARSATGIPVDVFSTGEARWLGVATQGQPEQPRVLLVSVPYAIKASDAETLGGLPASAFLRADAASTTYTNTAAVSSAAAKIAATAALTVTGQAGYLPVVTDASGNMGDSAVFQYNANIGIGTTTPANALSVVGTASASKSLVVGTGSAGLATSNTVDIIVKDGGGNNVFRGVRTTTGWADHVSTGFFEVGTSGDNVAFSATSGTKMSRLQLSSNVTQIGGSYYNAIPAPISGDLFELIDGSNNHRLVVQNAGNVGIGTTAPTSPLTVNGIIQSTTGGFKFPDGTTQTTASTGSVILNGNNSFVGSETITGSAAAGTTALTVKTSATGASAVSGTATAASSSGVSGTGQNGATGVYATSDFGLGLNVASSSANIDGGLRLGGLQESGSEALGSPTDTPCASGSCLATPSVPYSGLVVRRFKSADRTAGAVVAYALIDNTNPLAPVGVSLQRDGTSDGFQLVTDATLTAGIPISYACQGSDSGDNPLNTHGNFVSPATQPVYSSGNNLISFHCVFGRLADAANYTDVTLTRYNQNSPIWVGTIISDTNQ